MNKCPTCGRDGLLLFSSFECSNGNCKNYVKQKENCEIKEPKYIGKSPNKNGDIFPIVKEYEYLTKRILEGLQVPKEFFYPTIFTETGIINHLCSNNKVGQYIEDISIKNISLGRLQIIVFMESVAIDYFSYSEIEEILIRDLEEIKPAGVVIKWIIK